MFFLGVLVFLAIEIAAFVAVGAHIGFGWAVLILLGVSCLGPFLVRRVGLGVLARTRDRLVQGELPTRELLDGVVVLFAGAMVCVPGFVTDALGLLLMSRTVRSILIGAAGHRLARRVRSMGGFRWRVINVDGRAAPDDAPIPRDRPQGSIGPGGPIDD